MGLLALLRRTLRDVLHSPAAPAAALLETAVQLELSREFARLQTELRASTPENPASYGFKVYSQADEDGILENICLKLGLKRGVFAEIGCGDGRENNTHYLLLKGWSGAWVDSDSSNIASIRRAIRTNSRLHVVEARVTRENVRGVLEPMLHKFGPELDLLTVDVDGNDLAIAQAAVTAFSPKIVVGEYNAKFRYPMVAQTKYDPKHEWQGDDYQGASLAAWVQGLVSGYRLVACNLAGTNAFFIRSDLSDCFSAYPPETLYQPARFHLTALRVGHAPSLSFLRQSLADDRAELKQGVDT